MIQPYNGIHTVIKRNEAAVCAKWKVLWDTLHEKNQEEDTQSEPYLYHTSQQVTGQSKLDRKLDKVLKQ